MSSYQRGRVSCITLDHNMSTRCLGRHHLLTCRHAQSAIASSSRHSAPGKLISRPGHWTHGLVPAGAWLVLSPSVLTWSLKHIHALALLLDFADIFTDSRYFYCFLRCCKGQQQQMFNCLLLLEGWHVLCSANDIVSFKFVAINNHCPVSIISLHHIWSLLL